MRAVLVKNCLLIIRVQDFNTFLIQVFRPSPVDFENKL